MTPLLKKKKKSKAEENSAQRQISGWISKKVGLHTTILLIEVYSIAWHCNSLILYSGPQTPLQLLQFKSLKSESARAAGQIITPAHTSSLRAGSGFSSVCHVDAPQCHRSARSAPFNSSDQTFRHSHSLFCCNCE